MADQIARAIAIAGADEYAAIVAQMASHYQQTADDVRLAAALEILRVRAYADERGNRRHCKLVMGGAR